MLETIITSSVLIAVLILLRYLFKGKINVRLQYALWLLVALRLILPFSIVSSSLSVLNIVDISGTMEQIESPVMPPSGSAGITGDAISEESAGPVGGSGISLDPGQVSQADSAITQNEKASVGDTLYSIWLVGAVATGLWFVLQNIWFYRRLRKTREAAEIQISRLPVYLTRCAKSPCLFGLLRPAVYIHPESLKDGIALKYILAHEETHYRHGDHLWSYLRCVCLAIHWFNPLVWWAAVLSRRDCEIACDESTLNRIGDAHRIAYGNTLIEMITRRARPSDLLSGATTMTSGISGIKERITMIAKKPKMLASTLLAVILIISAVVGCTFTGAKPDESPSPSLSMPPEENTELNITLYERAGVTIAMPNEYLDQLLIDPVEHDDGRTLISVYQKSTFEKYEGMGLLFSIVRYTEAQYEQFLSSDRSGQGFFAKDGTYYYGFFFATDVQSPDDYESFSALFSAVGDFVKSDVISRNGLTPYSDNEFFNRTYTYDSAHVYYKYYPYYAVNGSKEEVWTLFLSQPATQGTAGIWCVERWRDQSGNVYPYFPYEDGKPAREYYEALQLEADAGRQTALLNPEQAAISFAKKAFGHSVTLGSFERAENSGIPSELFAQSSGNIHDYMPKLIAGETVSAYDLLPCFGNFTHSTWLEVERTYSGPHSDWWGPLYKALRQYAVSEMRADTSDQLLRDYYIGKARLTSDGAYSEGLDDIVYQQWNNDSPLYVACMNSQFTADEAASLRSILVYLASHRGGLFHLYVPGDDPELNISLNIFPVDFPFGTGLTETSRETKKVESFGMSTTVQGDGLEVRYLNNYEGVYFVTCIRTVKEGYRCNGVAIGDPEEKLWDHWIPTQLRKLDSISYDDEAWFGSDYDYAYVHTPQDSIKSVVYLVKDGLVWGIELINGLDGPMYP